MAATTFNNVVDEEAVRAVLCNGCAVLCNGCALYRLSWGTP